jgi:hypothetical protein
MTRSYHRVQPQCLSLVLCDAVIEDVRTRNKTLVSMFNGILTPQVPVRHDKMCAFAALTGGRGQVALQLRLCFDPEYEKDLLRLGGTVEFPQDDPQATVDMVFEMRGFVFQHFGRYTFELVCDGVPIMSRRFAVSRPAQAQPADEPPPPPPPPTL